MLTLLSALLLAAVPTDLGAHAGTDTRSVTIVLSIPDRAGLDSFVERTTNPQSPSFRHFLTPAQFTAQWAPSSADVAAVVSHLQANGIAVSSVSPSRLAIKATGTVAALNKYFSVNIHDYSTSSGKYLAPDRVPTIPSAVSGKVATVVGLSTERIYHPHLTAALKVEPLAAVAESTIVDNGTGTGIPQKFTVGDVARLYQVGPLYQQGIKGQGRTIGIATLANFNQADAYHYWAAIGLKVKANRITEVLVDGGTDANGADETTLDVQQSGGLAPQANIIVYEAPNTDQGFFDVFLQAFLDNSVDTLSVSWGSPEIATTPQLAAGQDVVFAALASEGVSAFAASGDSGAYDINNGQLPWPVPGCQPMLTVDSPASSPYITAAGGLTLPGAQQHKFGVVTVPNVRPWAWDYLADYLNTNYPQFGGYYGVGDFPVGGGGGVSVNEALPRYQSRTSGVQTSAPSQSLLCYGTVDNGVDNTGALVFQDLIDLPANQPGRNVPDLSLNADPETGYLLYFGGNWYSGFGGTSFVAPQLNGITSLIGQANGSRLGLLNHIVYRLARHGGDDDHPAFNDVTSDDNLGYSAVPGYDPASGIGSINAANLARQIGEDQGDDD